jgi:hypothetical protein
MANETAQARYYLDGYTRLQFDMTKPASQRLGQVMNEILLQGLRSSAFSWEEQEQKSLTLRPAVYEYDPVFLDVLFENDIPARLLNITARNLTLFHVQVVRSQPGPEYVSWHRDTQFYDGEKVSGNIPPAHKIIFYPRLPGGTAEPRLHVLPGSNRVMFPVRELDYGLLQAFPTDTISASNEEALLFDTSLFHSVIADTLPIGSIRLIYSFASPEQAAAGYLHKPIHANLNRIYEERVRRAPRTGSATYYSSAPAGA